MGIDDFTIRQYYDQELIDMMEAFNVTEWKWMMILIVCMWYILSEWA